MRTDSISRSNHAYLFSRFACWGSLPNPLKNATVRVELNIVSTCQRNQSQTQIFLHVNVLTAIILHRKTHYQIACSFLNGEAGTIVLEKMQKMQSQKGSPYFYTRVCCTLRYRRIGRR